MAEKSTSKRGMGSIRGFPPLPIAEKENSENAVIGHAVIASAILDSSNVFFEENSGISSQDLALVKTAVRSIFRDMVGAELILEEFAFQDFLGWHIELRGGHEILGYELGYEINVETLKRVDQTIRETLDLELQFYVSSVYPLDNDFSLAIDEVTTLYDRALLLGETKQIVANRYDERETVDVADDDCAEKKLNLEKLFFNAVITRNFHWAEDLMNQIMDLELQIPEMAHSIKPRISNRLAWIIYVLGTPPTDIPLKRNLMADIACLDEIDNFAEFRGQISAIFQAFDQDYNPRCETNSLFDKIVTYIDENFRDCNLSGGAICDEFEITAPYLSRMFRKNMDMTMLDYIHTVRINAVKRMLIETDCNIQDIARNCGYFSGWTMVRAFKKYEEISPGEYRKSSI